MYNIYVRQGKAPMLIFGDVNDAYCWCLSNAKDYTFVDVVYVETGEVVLSFHQAQLEWYSIDTHLDIPMKQRSLGECVCDFSHGNWGCTCGAFKEEQARK